MPNEELPHNRQNLPKADSIYYTHPAQKARISMIAVPIGNLADITHRALDALEKVDELWCEDTRHTQALLNALGISRPRLKRVDQHTSMEEFKKLLKGVEDSGQWIGVVTDAGTPGISDPGAKIVELLTEFPRVRVEPIPGPSAVSAFVSIAGITSGLFQFQGFFPRNDSDIDQLLSDLKDNAKLESHVFFESPNRVSHSVGALKKWCETLDFTPKFVFAKELTKLHETIWSGEGLKFLEWLQLQSFDERGEWVFSITLPKNYVINRKAQADWELTLECLIEAEISTKDAANLIASRFSVAKKLAYQTALAMLELKKKLQK
jgi:16S rRNA (cytidine1402-2'-O)-methyltransferase